VSDFDKYADDYERRMQETLAVAFTSEEYQARYKSGLIKRYFAKDRKIESILDFGCGVGLSVPSLKELFPATKLFLTDISEASLNVAQQKHSGVTVLDSSLSDNGEFDVIFLSTVVHHISPSERIGIFNRLREKLSRNGCLFIVEHNTYNPLTRKIVANCEMDADAELISIRDLRQLLTNRCHFRIADSGFCSFFPEPLKGLTRLDGLLKRIPLGGQYFVVATA